MNSHNDPAPVLNSLLSENSESFEPTLRLLAQVAIPEGLEARIHARLKASSQPVGVLGATFSWLRGRFTAGIFKEATTPFFAAGWMRAAAAASLAAVIAGGGWVVTSNAHLAPVGGVETPAPSGELGSGGFGGAKAIRRAQPLQPPVPIQRAPVQPKALAIPEKKAAKKSAKDKLIIETDDRNAPKPSLSKF